LAKEGVRGFQTMRRDDVTITSHTTSISIMTVVSDHALPQEYLEKVNLAHQMIDVRYRAEITKHVIVWDKFNPKQFRQIFENVGMRLYLLRGVKVDQTKIPVEGQTYLPKNDVDLLRRLNILPTDHILKIDELRRYLRRSKFSQEVAAYTILLAYETGLLVPVDTLFV
jgi:hypothetical protein